MTFSWSEYRRQQWQKDDPYALAAEALHCCCETLLKDLGISEDELADLLQVEHEWFTNDTRYEIAHDENP